MHDNDKQKGNNVASPSVVNMLQHNNSSRYNDKKSKCKHHVNTTDDPNKKSKVTYLRFEKHKHLKKDCKSRKFGNKGNGSGTNTSVNGFTSSKGVTQEQLCMCVKIDAGTKDEVSNQDSYYFNVEDDHKTYDEAMKSQDVGFWKKAINDEMDSTIGNNTWVLADLPPCYKPLGCEWIFKGKLKVDLTNEFLSSRFSMKDMEEPDVILGIKINMKNLLSTGMEENAVHQGWNIVEPSVGWIDAKDDFEF
nr:zinc finger, CCHC-type [Tanacetum cinerariifolium]